LTLDRQAFTFYDVTKKGRRAEPGEFMIQVGGFSDNIRLRNTFALTR
jgi:hypothetical protein